MILTEKMLRRIIKEELQNLKESSFVFGNQATMPGNRTADRIQNDVAIIWNNEEKISEMQSRINELQSILDQNPEQTTQWRVNTQIKNIEQRVGNLYRKNEEANKRLENMGATYESEVEKYQE